MFSINWRISTQKGTLAASEAAFSVSDFTNKPLPTKSNSASTAEYLCKLSSIRMSSQISGHPIRSYCSYMSVISNYVENVYLM